MNLAIALIVFVALLTAAVLYLRQHHINLYQKLHDRLSQNNGSLDQALSSAFDSLHHRLDDIHTATQTPVAVAMLSPQATAAAPKAPVSATPQDAAAAPTVTGTSVPAPAEVQPISVVFDPSQYSDVPSRMAAAQALLQSLVRKWGNYNTKVVGPHGWPIDPSGAEVPPDTGPSMEDVSSPDTLQFVDGGTPAIGNISKGVAIYLKGSCTKVIKGVPGNMAVWLYQWSGHKAGDYKFFINNQLVQAMTAGISIQTFPAPGGDVTLSIQQPDDCSMLACFQSAS